MRRLCSIAAVLAASAAAPALALDCPTADGRDVASFRGELAAGQSHDQPFGAGWRFVLEPVEAGWVASIVSADGIDLSWATPPQHGPNPRQLLGWHFRNAANTGPNTGDVNAPQYLRLLSFFSDTGEIVGIADRSAAEPTGRGAIEIVDMGLADLDPGEQARMVFLSFETCLSWPALEAAVPTAGVSPELIEQLGACGLDWPRRVSGHLEPPGLSADFDGDGTLDTAAAIIDEDSGSFGIAICRAGTWLDVLGAGNAPGPMSAEDFDRIDTWMVYPLGEIGSRTIASLGLVGDSLFVGTGGRPRMLLYWTGSGFAASDQGS